LADVLNRALKPAIDEAARTLRADRLESDRAVASVAVSGRWSAVGAVGQAVARELGLACTPWPTVSVAGVQRHLGPAALAAGLALVATRGGNHLNLRRGEFVYGRERAGLRRRLVALGALAAFALAAGGVDWGVRLSLKERRWAEVDGRVRAAFQEVLPGATIVSEPEQLQAAIDTLTKQRAFLGGTLGVLDVLLALESAVAKLPNVRAVGVSDAKTTADQSKVRFIMNVTLAEGV
jgi:hypothetical protein